MFAARVLVYKQLEECKLMQRKAKRIRRDEERGLCIPNPVCPCIRNILNPTISSMHRVEKADPTGFIRKQMRL